MRWGGRVAEFLRCARWADFLGCRVQCCILISQLGQGLENLRLLSALVGVGLGDSGEQSCVS